MATPYRSTYVTIGTLMMGSRAIDAHDWAPLLSSPTKKGDDLDISGRDGLLVQDGANDEPRYGGPLMVLLPLRLDGAWTQDNARVNGDGARIDAFYEHLAALRGTTEVLGVQTLTLTGPSGPILSEDCIVQAGGRPDLQLPWFSELVLDLLLPDGIPTLLTEGS